MMQKFWPVLTLLAVGLLALALMNPWGGSGEPAPTALVITDVEVGDGQEAKKGDKVEVHYTGKLLSNGKQFDSSRGKAPFTFDLGTGSVIQGWDKGVVGMKEGGKRKLVIPSELAYGKSGSPPTIPPDAALVFEVELLKVLTPSKLGITDVEVGTGKEAKDGDMVDVHYTGKLASNSQQFDSSRGGAPFSFRLGAGSVIQGWDQGVPGMKEGGKRKLHIPAHLAYGQRGSPPTIPPNADLVFDVELVRVR